MLESKTEYVTPRNLLLVTHLFLILLTTTFSYQKINEIIRYEPIHLGIILIAILVSFPLFLLATFILLIKDSRWGPALSLLITITWM